MTRVALLGPNGQVGRAIREILPEVIPIGRDLVNMANPLSLLGFDWSGFDAIINCAAYTKVDQAETEPDLARAVNSISPGILAEKARGNGAILIHFSTDYVFDGTQELHTEDERPNPLSVYGSTKHIGDVMALQHTGTYDIRTSWVIGDGSNFARTILSLVQKGVAPSVVADQYGRPTFATELARTVEHLLAERPKPGLYNLSNGGDVTTWYAIAQRVYELAGASTDMVSPTDTDSFFKDKAHAPRPVHSTFDLGKIGLTGFEPVNWEDALETYIGSELRG